MRLALPASLWEPCPGGWRVSAGIFRGFPIADFQLPICKPSKCLMFFAFKSEIGNRKLEMALEV
jgi:hypothetical protein